VSSWFVELDDAVVEVDVQEGIIERVGRPLDQPWLGPVAHDDSVFSSADEDVIRDLE
jgi:hypothetical protein